jgi:chromosome partitioning protein
MQTVLVASSKGGCGKSTLVTHLAAHYAQQGENTVIVDADRQGSSYRWCARRPDSVPGVLALEGRRRHIFERLPPDTGRILIDTPAGIGERELEPLLAQADAVVVPILPSPFDFDASLAFIDMLAQHARIRRGRLPVALVANRLRPWTHTSQNVLAAMQHLPFPVAAELRDSQAYVMLAGLGKGIFDYHSEQIRSHQADWLPLLDWLQQDA